MVVRSVDGFRALTVDVDDALCVVTLNEPENRNTITREMHDELTRVWPVVAELEGIRCVILTGAGRAFTVGGDIKAMAEGEFVEPPGHAMFAADRNLIYRFLNVPCPVVCAINGDCIGLGASLALMSDFSVMADDARIGDPHVRVGLVAGDGGIPIWPLLVGLNRAKEALLLGRLYSAGEAKTMGLVGGVCPRDDVLSEARKLVRSRSCGRSARRRPWQCAGRDELPPPTSRETWIDSPSSQRPAVSSSLSWFDLMFDVQVLPYRRSSQLPDSVLDSISGRGDDHCVPNETTVALTMLVLLALLVTEAVRGTRPVQVNACSLSAAARAIGLAIGRMVGAAQRFGARTDSRDVADRTCTRHLPRPRDSSRLLDGVLEQPDWSAYFLLPAETANQSGGNWWRRGRIELPVQVTDALSLLQAYPYS